MDTCWYLELTLCRFALGSQCSSLSTHDLSLVLAAGCGCTTETPFPEHRLESSSVWFGALGCQPRCSGFPPYRVRSHKDSTEKNTLIRNSQV